MNDYFEAEDLAQETFLSVYKNLSTFDKQFEKAWLCKIATNKALDYIKRFESRSVLMEEEYFHTKKDMNPLPEENILEQEAKRQLLDCCSNLKPPYQEIALDYFYKELSMGDIVEKSGKNLKTVQTQIYRARAMLQKKYRKGADENGTKTYHG